MKEKYGFDDLVKIIRRLRSENGCPWDKVQTHESLRSAMIEEAYEAVDAINNGDMENLCEELGDVLMQVIFHAEIERENGGFSLEDVYDGISKKMISRHSHIFANDVANTPEEVVATWEKNKKKEKGFETHTEMLESVPHSLPSIIRASKLQKRAADAGLAVRGTGEAMENIKENIAKLEGSIEGGEAEKFDAFGELLFSVVNISAVLGVNAEFALTNSSEKFINRFRYIEEASLLGGMMLENLTIEQMDKLWEKSKQCN